jgi:GTP-binding protein LepA C-terminus
MEKVLLHSPLYVIVTSRTMNPRPFVERYITNTRPVLIYFDLSNASYVSIKIYFCELLVQLKDVLPRQQFVTIIQAKADGKIVASERIQAYRKDVLTKSGKTVGGGDQTRKMKLLEKQKKGKERMQQSGKVSLSQEAFNSVISRST